MVGLDKRRVIVLQQKVTPHQLARRLSNIPRCLIGTETCSGTHFIGCQVTALGHEVRVILLWPWIEQASKRMHRNMLAIALANKLARIAWAVLARGQDYQSRVSANAA